MIIIYLDNIISVNFDLYEKVIINVKMFKRFNVIKRFDRIFKRKFEDIIFLRIKFIFINVILYFLI